MSHPTPETDREDAIMEAWHDVRTAYEEGDSVSRWLTAVRRYAHEYAQIQVRRTAQEQERSGSYSAAKAIRGHADRLELNAH